MGISKIVSPLALALAASCAVAPGCGGQTVAPQTREADPNGDAVPVDPFDPSDGQIVRLHDLVITPGSSLRVLAEQEFGVAEGPFADDLGRNVATIRSTGRFAAQLSRYGLIAEGHRHRPTNGTVFKTLTQATCGAWPISSQYFQWYDFDASAYHGGIANEITTMFPGSFVTVAQLPAVPMGPSVTTWQGRKVLGVQVGPTGVPLTTPVPTVYVLATHHAREWGAEEVVMELARLYVNSVRGLPGGDPAIPPTLSQKAVVFVPVVNPDGYQYSRTTFRDQRKNRVGSCIVEPQGVDLNRNYSRGWGLTQPNGADFGSSDGCTDVYWGPGPNSEVEVQAMQNLLAGHGFSFAGGAITNIPVAMLTYHTFGDNEIYPQGLRLPSDPNPGPNCYQARNCLNPNFVVYRGLFGNYESPQMRDFDWNPPFSTPYNTEQENEEGYTTNGDATAYANDVVRILGITPELNSRSVDFHIECEPNYMSIVANMFTTQKAVVANAIAHAAELTSTSPSVGFAPTRWGNSLSTGVFVREVSDALNNETARGRILVGQWAPTHGGIAPPATMAINVDGVASTANLARIGGQYNLYKYDPPDPLMPPGSIVAGRTGFIVSSPPNLCDPNRFPHDRWNLTDSTRGGIHDCWWEPTVDPFFDATLTLPGGAMTCPAQYPPKPNYGHLSFSVQGFQGVRSATSRQESCPSCA